MIHEPENVYILNNEDLIEFLGKNELYGLTVHVGFLSGRHVYQEKLENSKVIGVISEFYGDTKKYPLNIKLSANKNGRFTQNVGITDKESTITFIKDAYHLENYSMRIPYSQYKTLCELVKMYDLYQTGTEKISKYSGVTVPRETFLSVSEVLSYMGRDDVRKFFDRCGSIVTLKF